MSPGRINPFIPLFIGVACIVAALVGAGAVFLQEGKESGDAPPPTSEESKAPARPDSVVAAAPSAREDSLRAEEEREQREVARREQAVQLLLKRIEQTPAELDGAWLAGTFLYVKDEADLQRFYEEFLARGAQRNAAYEAAQKNSKKVLPGDPRYFVSQARQLLYAKDMSEQTLLRGVPENLAMGLHREKAERGGLENADEAFMSSFYRELTSMYGHLQRLSEERGESRGKWFEKYAETLEAAVVDRYLSIERRKALVRQEKEGTAQSAAPELMRTEILEKAIGEHLLDLGKLYKDEAASEVVDRERLQMLAERAFTILAMVYQRTHSGQALNTMREVNEIQEDYLYRMARASWKRAQLASAAGQVEQADESYFAATQRYLQCMSRAVDERREELVAEYRQLKEEIAAWQMRKKQAGRSERGS